MKENKTYRLLVAILILVCVGCQEQLHIEDVSPSLYPRYLSLDKEEVSSPTADAYATEISVTSAATPWKFEDYPSWISMAPNRGDDNMDVSVCLTENISADTARYALFFLSDDVDDWDYKHAVSVSQPSAKPYLILSDNLFVVSGATNRCNVEVSSNAMWSVENTTSWIKVEKLEQSLQIEVLENNTGGYREAHLSVHASTCTEIITISQAPANAESTESRLEFPNSAASATFAVTSETAWSATVSESWLQIDPEMGSAGLVEATVDVAPNTSIAERKGYITFQCNGGVELFTMEIVQKGLYVEADADEVFFEAQSCSRVLEIHSNVDWTVTAYPEWAIPSVATGSGESSISIQAEENTSTYERSGFLVLESPGLSLSARVQLTQKGKTFETGTTLLEFSDKASTNTVKIVTDGDWVAVCDAEWVTLSPRNASGNSTLSVSVTENTADSERMAIAHLTVSDKTIELTIRQQGKYLSIDNEQLTFPSKGGDIQLFIATNDTWKASLEENASWLNLSESEGIGEVDLVVHAMDNASVNERRNTLHIATLNNLSVSMPIRQEARYLSVSARDILFFARGGTSETISIETNGEYKISQVGDWFAITRQGNTFVVTALENKTDGVREGGITIALTDLVEGSYEVTIPVVQVQIGCSFTLLGYEEDIDQDENVGDGGFTNDDYGVDNDWNASFGNSFSVSLIDFMKDSNWDTHMGKKFSVTVTGYDEASDWDNSDSTNTTLEKDSYDEDENENNGDVTDITLGKQGFGVDNNWDE